MRDTAWALKVDPCRRYPGEENDLTHTPKQYAVYAYQMAECDTIGDKVVPTYLLARQSPPFDTEAEAHAWIETEGWLQHLSDFTVLVDRGEIWGHPR